MNNELKINISNIILLLYSLFSLCGFVIILNNINDSNQIVFNFLNLGEIIFFLIVLFLLYKEIKLIFLIKITEEMQMVVNFYVFYFLILICLFSNSILYGMILNFYFFIIFEILLILGVIFSPKYLPKFNNMKYKENLYNNGQIKFLSIEENYFTPYLSYLIFQYNYKRNINFINIFIFLGIFFSVIIGLPFKDQNLLIVFVTILQYITFWFICMIIIFVIPMTYLNFKFKNKFRDVIEPYKMGNFELIEKKFQKFELGLESSFSEEKNKAIISYFKAIILANSGMYSEALELLNSYVGLTLNSMAIKYEFFSLMSQIYNVLNEKEKAKEMGLKSISGFKKISFFTPLKPLEVYLTSI